MRGVTLFDDLLPADENLRERHQKGRNKNLLEKRNELLIDRLYHLKKMFGFDYEYVLKIISDEFFLAELTIPQVVQQVDCQMYLRRIKLEQPSRNELEKKWPHLVWNEKSLLNIYGMRVLKTA